MTTSTPGRHARIIEEMREAQERIEELAEYDTLTASEDAEFTQLRDRFLTLNSERTQLERNADREKVRAASRGEGGMRTLPANGETADPVAGRAAFGDRRDAAMRTLDAAVRSRSLDERSAEKVEKLLSTGLPDERNTVAEWVNVTGKPEYFRAFTKLAADPLRGHLMWTEAERAAFTDGGRVQALLSGRRDPFATGERAMSLTDANGGYLVPFQLDPSVIITSAGASTGILSAARRVTATGDAWNGVSSAGVTNSWDAEASEVSDDSPTFAQPSIPIYTNRTFVPISIEALMDAASVATEVGRLIADEALNAQHVAATTGTGSGQPTGLITAAVAASATVAPTTAETFAKADVYKVQNALAARYQANATWHANLAFINIMRQFETTNGSKEFPELASGQLLGRTIYENSAMDAALNAAATETNYVLAYGDLSNYVIADRIGLTVELIPHLFHTSNNRPSGQRGWFAYFRQGAGLVNANAVKVLSIPTTA